MYIPVERTRGEAVRLRSSVQLRQITEETRADEDKPVLTNPFYNHNFYQTQYGKSFGKWIVCNWIRQDVCPRDNALALGHGGDLPRGDEQLFPPLHRQLRHFLEVQLATK